MLLSSQREIDGINGEFIQKWNLLLYTRSHAECVTQDVLANGTLERKKEMDTAAFFVTEVLLVNLFPCTQTGRPNMDYHSEIE